jgi:hypothetical protein
MWENKIDLQDIVWEVVDWNDLVQDNGHVAGCCEHGNEPSGFLDCLRDCQLLKSDSVLWS